MATLAERFGLSVTRINFIHTLLDKNDLCKCVVVEEITVLPLGVVEEAGGIAEKAFEVSEVLVSGS